jgi:hypothetical protein
MNFPLSSAPALPLPTFTLMPALVLARFGVKTSKQRHHRFVPQHNSAASTLNLRLFPTMTATFSDGPQGSDTSTVTHSFSKLENFSPELLRRFVQHALRQGLTFSFEQFDQDGRSWTLFATGGNGKGNPIVNWSSAWRSGKRRVSDTRIDSMPLQLLRVSKIVASEARGKCTSPGT